jgi:hypothetical protein
MTCSSATLVGDPVGSVARSVFRSRGQPHVVLTALLVKGTLDSVLLLSVGSTATLSSLPGSNPTMAMSLDWITR